MSNEEMALAIQSGRTELYPELWKKVERLIAKKSHRIYTQYKDACDLSGVTVEDIVQCGYIALTEAVSAFKPSSGYKLVTYISLPLLTQVFTLIGARTGRSDAINRCISIETPTGGKADAKNVLLLSETLCNEKAAEDMQRVIDNCFNKQLRDMLDRICDTLEPLDREIIQARYYEGLTMSEILKRYNISKSKFEVITRRAMKVLRKDSNQLLLKPFADEV